MCLDQLCSTRGPVKGFMRPSLGFRCSKSILHTDNLSVFWLSKIWHFCCRWSSVLLYEVCHHCSWDSNAFSTLALTKPFGFDIAGLDHTYYDSILWKRCCSLTVFWLCIFNSMVKVQLCIWRLDKYDQAFLRSVMDFSTFAHIAVVFRARISGFCRVEYSPSHE